MALENSNIFPLQENVYDNLHLLLSGPAGLGQNFSGVSSYTNAYLTGTFRQPFTVPTTVATAPVWYSTANIGNIIVQGVQNITVEFTAPFAAPPFAAGDTITIAGVTDSYPTTGNTFYDGTYVSGVTNCTVSNVSIQTAGSYDWPTYISGGTITKDNTDTLVSTDANARVTVYGPTDRVFISAQTNLNFSYTASVASEFNIKIQINRYQGFIDRTDPNNLDYAFSFDGLVSEQVFNFTPTGSGSSSIPEVIFTSIIDSPNFGYYWYILEMEFQYVSGDVKPETFTVGLRGLTAQVVKE